MVTFVRFELDSLLGDDSPLLLYTLAMMAAGAMGGWKPGLLATVLSAVVGTTLFIEPKSDWLLPVEASDQVRILLFLTIGVLCSLGCETSHRRRRLIEVQLHELKQANEQVRNEMRLRLEQEAHFRQLVEGVRDYAIYMLDPQGVVVTWNSGAEMLTRYKTEEIVGQHFSRFHTAESTASDHPRQVLERAAALGRSVEEGWRVRKDGSRFWAHVVITALHDAHGKLQGFSKIARDLTERRQAEMSLLVSERRFREMANTAPVLIWTSGPDKLRDWFNQPWLAFTGRTTEQEIGSGWVAGVHPEDQARCMDAYVRAFDARESFRMEFRLRRHDGEFRWVLDQGLPLATWDGAFVGYIGSAIDITDRIQAEELSRQALQQSRALSGHLQSAREEERVRIARELHDDLGQALTALKLDVSSLHLRTVRDIAWGPDDDAMLAEMTRRIDATIHSVRRIMTELRPGVLDRLGLSAALEWIAHDVQKRAGIACTCCLPDPEPSLGDQQATALFRICQEALTNVVRHAAATEVRIQLEQVGDVIVLSIRDNGRGLAGAAPRKDSFGLQGMRERAEGLAGTFEIASAEGSGTTVTVSIPYRAGRGIGARQTPGTSLIPNGNAVCDSPASPAGASRR